ncbi:BhlA/UviB family holin-like peptide [Alkaliphilus sp. B6464]|nr:BhlA/UviB family holin-like peptide [Alkaliphilus sp. B6464]QUH19527.1 hypothetical protein HYG84_06240 [Alkaliphilus sp. B6464]
MSIKLAPHQGKIDIKQEERAHKYQEIISTLTDKLNVIKYVKKM